MKLDAVAGVDVWIHSNGVALTEYEDEEYGGEVHVKGVKYVEAVAGSDFTVSLRANTYKLKAAGRKYQVEKTVTLDGKRICSTLCNVQSYASHSYSTPGLLSMVNGKLTLQKFTFGILETNDGAVGGFQTSTLKQLGQIVVELRFVRKVSDATLTAKPMESTKSTSIPEKCLKGQSLLGTLRDLQIEGVVPRSPSPEDLEDKDPDDLSPEEARELVRRMRARQHDTKDINVKKEKRNHATLVADDEDHGDDEVTVSDVRERKRARASNDPEVEVINLCDE